MTHQPRKPEGSPVSSGAFYALCTLIVLLCVLHVVCKGM